jgi:hypothetical protein
LFYHVFLFKDVSYELIQNLSASTNISFNFPYNTSSTYNFSYQSINQFGASYAQLSNSITFDVPFLVSVISLSFKNQKLNISIKASERFSRQYILEDYQLQALNY